jgi:hypothetical protein
MNAKRGFAFSILCGLVALATFVPARGALPTMRLVCHAWGSFDDYAGDAEGYDVWPHIQAAGTCSGAPSGPLDVTLNGDGLASYGTFNFDLIMGLSDAAGHERYAAQLWTGINYGTESPARPLTCPARLVIENRGGLPLGFGSMSFPSSWSGCNYLYANTSAPAWMTWNILIQPWT